MRRGAKKRGAGKGTTSSTRGRKIERGRGILRGRGKSVEGKRVTSSINIPNTKRSSSLGSTRTTSTMATTGSSSSSKPQVKK